MLHYKPLAIIIILPQKSDIFQMFLLFSITQPDSSQNGDIFYGSTSMIKGITPFQVICFLRSLGYFPKTDGNALEVNWLVV